MRLNPGLICGVLLSLLSAVPTVAWAQEMGPKIGENSKLSPIVTPAGIAQLPPFDMTLSASVKNAFVDPKTGEALPVTYSWDLNDDGDPDSTETTVTVSAKEAGVQRVALTVTDGSGLSKTKIVMVRAQTPIQAQESLGYKVSVVTLLLTVAVFFIYFIAGNPVALGRLGMAGFIVGYAALLYSNIFRMFDSGRLPNIHLYEVLQLFSIFAMGCCLWISLKFRDARPMAYCATFVGTILLYISNFPGELKDPGIIQPALDSYWRNIHVTAIILSYGGIAAAFFASLSYVMSKSKLADHMAYKATMFAYPLLTAGIIMGGMWANEAWGTWWSWDPKETASLVIWLVLTAYLHTRMVLGWSGMPSAYLSMAGFASMLFCFVGLNFMPGNSLHKYAGVGAPMAPYITALFIVLPALMFISHRPWTKAAREKMAAEALAEGADLSEAGADKFKGPATRPVGGPSTQRGHIKVTLPGKNEES